MAILNIENVKKSYGNVDALRGVSLQVEKGEAVAIIGSSGSGKSTLLRCINNLEHIEGGSISIDNEYLAKDVDGKAVYKKEKELRALYTKTGMVFQHFNLFPHLSCIDNITIAPIKNLGEDKKSAEKKAKELLDMVGLPEKANSYPEQLSGGQKQRIAIARALALNPQIMLFDEPTSALDPEITGEVIRVILELVKQHITMVIVTHDMRFAKEAATRIIYMDQGMIVEQGTPEEIFDNPKSDRLKEFLSSLR